MNTATIHAATSHAEAKSDLFDDGNLDHENPHVRCLQRIARCRALLAQVNGILSVYQLNKSLTWGHSAELQDIEFTLKNIVTAHNQ